MLVAIRTTTTHQSTRNKGPSTAITKYQMRRRRGRISAAVQSICLGSSRGCIGNSMRPISDLIARMAQQSATRCMSCNIRSLAFGGLHVTFCCNYGGAGVCLLIAPSSDRRTLSICEPASVDRFFHMVCHYLGLHGSTILVTRMQAVEYTEAREDARYFSPSGCLRCGGNHC